MRNAIIVHGMPGKDEYYSPKYPSASNFQWIPWLQKQLLIADIPTATPEMPHAYMPDYSVWKREFERFDVTPETILVGHSCGGGFIVRWLSEQQMTRVGKVVLVAPWLDPDEELDTRFFDFKIDPMLVSRTKGAVIFNSDDDDPDVQSSVQKLRDTIKNITYIEFHNRGHFVGKEYVTNGFPELLSEILK